MQNRQHSAISSLDVSLVFHPREQLRAIFFGVHFSVQLKDNVKKDIKEFNLIIKKSLDSHLETLLKLSNRIATETCNSKT